MHADAHCRCIRRYAQCLKVNLHSNLLKGKLPYDSSVASSLRRDVVTSLANETRAPRWLSSVIFNSPGHGLSELSHKFKSGLKWRVFLRSFATVISAPRGIAQYG